MGVIKNVLETGRRRGGVWVYEWVSEHRLDGYRDVSIFKEEVISRDNSLRSAKQR